MSVRGVPDVVAKVRTRVDKTWATTVATEQRPPAFDPASGPEEAAPAAGPAWPHRFPVGRAASADLGADFGAHVRQLGEWRGWAAAHDVDLVYATRIVAGTRQQVVSHVVVPDLDTAVGIAGHPWPDLITTARTRAAVLHRQFPDQPNLPRAVRGTAKLSDVDFDVLLRVCDYFLQRAALADQLGRVGAPPAPLTPRQVPIEGVHAKWLDSHQGLVRTVTGLDDLGLLPPHPARFHFTYLDPDHLADGGRRHDSCSVGDTAMPSYQPRVVLISENKDTAIGFPAVPGGIAIEGEGRGAAAIASAPWVRAAPLVVYWGDLDQDGLEILNEFRAAGLTVRSMLMDVETYERYQRYGTHLDKNGNPVKVHTAREVPHLQANEAALYELLSSETAPVPRVEQERIPLNVPAKLLQALIDTTAHAGVRSLSVSSPAAPPLRAGCGAGPERLRGDRRIDPRIDSRTGPHLSDEAT